MPKDKELATINEIVKSHTEQMLHSLLTSPPEKQARSVNSFIYRKNLMKGHFRAVSKASLAKLEHTPDYLDHIDTIKQFGFVIGDELEDVIQEEIYRIALERAWPFEAKSVEIQKKEFIARLNAYLIIILKAPEKMEADDLSSKNPYPYEKFNLQTGFNIKDILYILAPSELVPVITKILAETRSKAPVIELQSNTASLALKGYVKHTFKFELSEEDNIPNIDFALRKLRTQLTNDYFIHPFCLPTSFDYRPRLIPNDEIYFKLIKQTEGRLLSREGDNAWYLFLKKYVVQNNDWEPHSTEEIVFESLKFSKEEYVFNIINELPEEKISYLKSIGILIYRTEYYLMIACRNKDEDGKVKAYIDGKSKQVTLPKTNIPQENNVEINLAPQKVSRRIGFLRNVFLAMHQEYYLLRQERVNSVKVTVPILEENLKLILTENHLFNFESQLQYFQFIENLVSISIKNIPSEAMPMFMLKNRVFTILLRCYLDIYLFNTTPFLTEFHDVALNYLISKQVFPDKKPAFLLMNQIKLAFSTTSPTNRSDFSISHKYYFKTVYQEILHLHANMKKIDYLSPEMEMDVVDIIYWLISSTFFDTPEIKISNAAIIFHDAYFEMMTYFVLFAHMNYDLFKMDGKYFIGIPAQESLIKIKDQIEVRGYSFFPKEYFQINFNTVIRMEDKIRFLTRIVLQICFFVLIDIEESVKKEIIYVKTKILPHIFSQYKPEKFENNKLPKDFKIDPEWRYQLRKALILLKMIEQNITGEEFLKGYLIGIYRAIPKSVLTTLELELCKDFLPIHVLNFPFSAEGSNFSEPSFTNRLKEFLEFKTALSEKSLQIQNAIFGIRRVLPEVDRILITKTLILIEFDFLNSLRKPFQNFIFKQFKNTEAFVNEKGFIVHADENTVGTLEKIKNFFEGLALVTQFFSPYGFSDFGSDDNLGSISINNHGVVIKIEDHEIALTVFLEMLNKVNISYKFKENKIWITANTKKFKKIQPYLNEENRTLLNHNLLKPFVVPEKPPQKSDVVEKTPVTPSLEPEHNSSTTSETTTIDSKIEKKSILTRLSSALFKDPKTRKQEEAPSKPKKLERTTSYYANPAMFPSKKMPGNTEQILTARSKRLSRQISMPLPKIIEQSISIEVADKVFYLNPNYLRTVQLETNPVIYIFMLRENEIRNSMKKAPMDILINPFRKGLEPSSDIDLTKAMDHFSKKLCKPLIGSDREYKFKLTIVFEGKKISTTDVPYTFELCSSGKER
ncbi:MAG: hypothetical protein JSS53_03630, partial [Proteobacteria bacterium]|nr:hypothetical protein [Pseudomonadota bacterium]